ncbi:MAG: nucleoside hydrolase [Anaerolineales bacterium]
MDERMNRIVIDTDPGVDDAQAILMATAHPETCVEAITCVAGNVTLERAVANALVIVDACEHDIPVYVGCDDALVVPTPRRAISHGGDGMGGANFPSSTRTPASEHAALALVRLANESPGALTLVAIGPLTNVALAMRLDPALPRKYKRLVVMGGAIRASGSGWTPPTEFNFWVDPEAAAVVIRAWPEVSLVSWEATLAHGFTAQQVDELAALGTSRSGFFNRITRNRMRETPSGERIMFAADPLAMAVALEPDIVRRAERRFVQVELAGALTRGQSVVDWFDVLGQPPNVNVILEVDRGRFFALMRQAVAGRAG